MKIVPSKTLAEACDLIAELETDAAMTAPAETGKSEALDLLREMRDLLKQMASEIVTKEKPGEKEPGEEGEAGEGEEGMEKIEPAEAPVPVSRE